VFASQPTRHGNTSTLPEIRVAFVFLNEYEGLFKKHTPPGAWMSHAHACLKKKMAFVFFLKNLNNSDFGLQVGLVPNKISGVGTNFGLLVHVLRGSNKQRGLEPSILLS
jgi:hypothetical protein